MAGEVERVRAMADRLAAAFRVDLLEVQVKGRGAGRVVRVVVDRKGGVDIATCQELSRALSGRLDAEDPIDGSYRLEVSSPGVDYPLRTRAAFDRVEGRAVLLHRRTGEDSPPAQVRGTVLRAEGDAVVLDVDGHDVRVPYDEVVTAKQALPW